MVHHLILRNCIDASQLPVKHIYAGLSLRSQRRPDIGRNHGPFRLSGKEIKLQVFSKTRPLEARNESPFNREPSNDWKTWILKEVVYFYSTGLCFRQYPLLTRKWAFTNEDTVQNPSRELTSIDWNILDLTSRSFLLKYSCHRSKTSTIDHFCQGSLRHISSILLMNSLLAFWLMDHALRASNP